MFAGVISSEALLLALPMATLLCFHMAILWALAFLVSLRVHTSSSFKDTSQIATGAPEEPHFNSFTSLKAVSLYIVTF